jgi:hypothetical protein
VLVAGKGLLLDFGGVLTSSLYGRMAEFCTGAGLPADAITAARALGMAAVHFTGAPGQLAEVERLLGLAPSGAGPERGVGYG